MAAERRERQARAIKMLSNPKVGIASVGRWIAMKGRRTFGKKVRRRVVRKSRTLRRRTWQRIAMKAQALELRARRRIGGVEAGGLRPENIVWIFGFGRSGSTWLMRMMRSMKWHNAWEEPMFGELFGSFYANAPKTRLRLPGYIASDFYRENWLRSIRNFVLESALQRYPKTTPGHYLIIKDSFGSVGAPLLVEALPESRMIFLVRDPRDIIASYLNAAKRGNWIHQSHMSRGIEDAYETDFAVADQHPDLFVEAKAELLMKNMMGAKRAYEAHHGPKVLVRYEELLADTLATMRRIYVALGLPVSEEELGRVVERHSWENIPEENKGEGKFHRKATPGSWRGDLTSEQTKTVERITAPILEEFYGDRT